MQSLIGTDIHLAQLMDMHLPPDDPVERKHYWRLMAERTETLPQVVQDEIFLLAPRLNTLTAKFWEEYLAQQ